MPSLRLLTCLGAIAVVLATAATSTGLASSQGTTSGQLATSSAGVASCDTDGVKVVPDANVTGTGFVSVTVSAIAPACGAATVAVDLNNGVAHAGGSAVVPAGGGGVTVTLSAPVTPTDAMQSDVAISGP